MANLRSSIFNLNSQGSYCSYFLNSSDALVPPNPKLLQQFIDANVSVSTVVIFPPANSEIGISNLQRIAHLTKGRFYSPEDPSDVAPILRREAKMRLRPRYLTTEFTPTPGQSPAGFPDLNDLPKLNGYAITTCKRDARLILDGPRRREVPPTCDPIFVMGNYGLGRTAAFTAGGMAARRLARRLLLARLPGRR